MRNKSVALLWSASNFVFHRFSTNIEPLRGAKFQHWLFLNSTNREAGLNSMLGTILNLKSNFGTAARLRTVVSLFAIQKVTFYISY